MGVGVDVLLSLTQWFFKQVLSSDLLHFSIYFSTLNLNRFSLFFVEWQHDMIDAYNEMQYTYKQCLSY